MPVVTCSELEVFIKRYLKKFSQLTRHLSQDQKVYLPKYLVEKCEIIATISRSKGVSIRFNTTKNKESFQCKYTEKSIENEVLPCLSAEGRVLFCVDRENLFRNNINMITPEFYDEYKDFIEKLTRGNNIIMRGIKKIVEVVSGDLKFVDCALAFCKDGKDILEKLDCLWLFGSNQSQDFSVEKAEWFACMEYQRLASDLVQLPLTEFKALIDSEETTEEDMQKFFEKNPKFLQWDTGKLCPQLPLLGKYRPDFIIETLDFRYVVVEIKSPNVNPRCFLGILRNAEMQIELYISFLRSHAHVDILLKRFPLLSVDNIEGKIVIGKSNKLSNKQEEILKRHRKYTKYYNIVTYDELYNHVYSLLGMPDLNIVPLKVKV
jgi:hypothetical protein